MQIAKNIDGWVMWIPIIKKGGELILAKTRKIDLKKGDYNPIEISKKKIYDIKEIHIPYGKALVFHKSILHKSSLKKQVSVQLRYSYPNYKKKFYLKSYNEKVKDKITRSYMR